MGNDYEVGLCECYKDIPTCLCTYFCCPCSVMRTRAWLENRPANISDYLIACLIVCFGSEFCCLGNAILCYWTWEARQKVQQKYDIDNRACLDIMSFCCCTSCFVCQDANELIAHNDNL